MWGGICLAPSREGNPEILDDIIIRKPQQVVNYLIMMLGPYVTRETLLLEYKLIRKCLEANRMFTEAADLFVREMKLARERLPWRNFLEKIAHYLYDCFSRYGESINRPILFGGVFIALMSSFLLYFNPKVNMYLTDMSQLLFKFLEHAHAVIAAFIQIKSFEDFPELASFPDNVKKVAETVTRILGVIALGNLFIALRRRLERH
jgi:hypothetical protein